VKEHGDRESLRERLTQLIADARAAGKMDELERAWRDLALLHDATEPRAAHDATRKRAPHDSKSAPASHDASTTSASSDDATTTSARHDSSAPIPMRFGMIGDSPPMRALFELLDKVAPSDVSVLIQGETGTGKELVALALHAHSARAAKPFLAENCAAVPANLLESELFGHKKGSFTGAVADRAGHFVVADGGTVFLDEIGDMPLAMQSKLLRVLQEGEVRPVGSNKTLHVDVRIVAATNKDLAAMCRAHTFREDLYYRLTVVTISLPPLRDRRGDVRHLVRFFLGSVSRELGRDVTIGAEAIDALERWRWPGNVRELENVLRRAAVFSKGEITTADLALPLGASA
jgi:transcriptional regulator with GAF, ATPase, and Fis domain